LGLTLIYGVLHIINFAHGAALMVALYAVYLLKMHLGIDPYLALPIVVPGMFGLGYALQRGIINRAGHGKDEYILLVTLGISIVLENLALLLFKSDTRAIETPYTLTTVAIGPAMIALPKLVAFAGALATSALLLLILSRTDLGRAIRAVAKEKQGAKLMGIDVDHVYAMCFGIGLACLGAAACFLLPVYYVNPQVGAGFVPVAFTIVVLGGMGSFGGALAGGLLVGVVESLGGLFLGESLGQIGIFAVFISVLLFRPQGLFGAKA
jgi:branched-chain amino acid transport system permease protein